MSLGKLECIAQHEAVATQTLIENQALFSKSLDKTERIY